MAGRIRGSYISTCRAVAALLGSEQSSTPGVPLVRANIRITQREVIKACDRNKWDKKFILSKKLFMITVELHTATAKGTLSRWMVDIIASSNQSGLGGSCRSAGPSKAISSSLSLSLETILEAEECFTIDS